MTTGTELNLAAGAGLEFRRIAMTPWRVAVIVWTIWSAVKIIAAAPEIAAGNLGDTDNYMRLVQLRDFLAGQDWFDVRQHRFVGFDGGDMHFSRLPDLILALPYWAASPFVGDAAAELLVLLATPPLLLLFLLAAAIAAAGRIGGDRAAIAAIALVMLAPSLTYQFVPGRIDHHGLALVLSAAALAAALRSPSHPIYAAGASISAALAAAVSLETAPVAAALFLALSYGWIRTGEAAALRVAGVTMFVASPAILGITLGPNALSDAHCDAYGAPAAFALTASAAAAVLLSFAPLKSFTLRLAACCVGGAIVGALAIVLFPACLGGPFEGMDPLVRDSWLSSVAEAKSPGALLRENPGALIAYYIFPIAAIGVGVRAFLRAKDSDRIQALAVALIFLVTTSLLLAAAVRGAALTALFAVIVVSAFLADASRNVRLVPPKGAAAFMALFLILSPSTFAVLGEIAKELLSGTPKADARATESASSCFDPSAIRALNGLQTTTLFTLIDLGPAILAHTDHRVTAAPYHRNDLSMRASIEFYTGDEVAARRAVDAAGADYVIFCPTSAEALIYAERAPSGLANALIERKPPAWLASVELKGAKPLEVYRIRRP